MEAFDEGSGPTLFAGGEFLSAGASSARYIARWDGAQWSALAGELDNQVRALTTFDDGTGAALYLGGYFTQVDGAPLSRVGKWDGNFYSSLGSGIIGEVHVLETFVGLDGSALYVAGNFTGAGGLPIRGLARWDGNAWSAPGGGLSRVGPFGPTVTALAAVNLPETGGRVLVVTGEFDDAGGVPVQGAATWDGVTWRALGDLDRVVSNGSSARPSQLHVFHDGERRHLLVAGLIGSANNQPFPGLARWSGSAWEPYAGIVSGGVGAMVSRREGPSNVLYLGGLFSAAGEANRASVGLARWDAGRVVVRSVASTGSGSRGR